MLGERLFLRIWRMYPEVFGERLLPRIWRIWRMYPDLSAKITGILLERENEEILKMIEKPDYLTTNVNNNK